ncbi:hypothetical protein BX600DRAFT_173246 [Xylariales sp. PMI_506]|nr:hypothetical protein BX600DRAFT_173246 [Xylariales sp. PMI_506]
MRSLHILSLPLSFSLSSPPSSTCWEDLMEATMFLLHIRKRLYDLVLLYLPHLVTRPPHSLVKLLIIMYRNHSICSPLFFF